MYSRGPCYLEHSMQQDVILNLSKQLCEYLYEENIFVKLHDKYTQQSECL